ncbi:MAG: Hsp20/alpha crystallin family protein [Chloroflexia bacterium]
MFRGNLVPAAWRDMARLQEEMNQLFTRIARPGASTFPATNMWLNEEGAVLTAELPGVKLEDLEISVVGATLTLKGARHTQQLAEGDIWHRRERGTGRFTKVLELPFRVEANQVGATLKNGVLSINLPRAQADRPRKIEINRS